MNFLEKIKFLLQKPKVVIVTGNGRIFAAKAIFQTLRKNFKIGKEIIILEIALEKLKECKFFVNNSSLSILIVTQIEDILSNMDFSAGGKEKTIEIEKLAKIIPVSGYLVLNFDDQALGEIKDKTILKKLTFGFQEGGDFRATDFIEAEEGINFKINYKGNTVPIWLEKLFGEEQIYAALAAAAVGTILGLNLVEISQALSKSTLPESTKQQERGKEA